MYSHHKPKDKPKRNGRYSVRLYKVNQDGTNTVDCGMMFLDFHDGTWSNELPLFHYVYDWKFQRK